ncbi:hypothetical protein POM88_020721 [Heracleum sosnowskyi]|uniref:Uncharacterized protein n=1 Tax=Heracleum sosnowskyi TaxID=360622 RepID=A0AAD8ICH9_9APIA|nr:hypothetical protein POM88_020721 [Heracleum sosnowskyi]
MVCFGFVFDLIGNDYKVVALLTCFGKPWTAEVYSANTNVWRRVEPNPKDLPSYDDFDVCVNGFLCCVGTYGDRKRNEVYEKSKRPEKRCKQGKIGKESSGDMAAHSACSFSGGKDERLALAKYRQLIWQGDQLAIAKETVRRLGMGTNTYTSDALLGQKKDGQCSSRKF